MLFIRIKISFRFIDKLFSTFPRSFGCNRHIPITRNIAVYGDDVNPAALNRYVPVIRDIQGIIYKQALSLFTSDISIRTYACAVISTSWSIELFVLPKYKGFNKP